MSFVRSGGDVGSFGRKIGRFIDWLWHYGLMFGLMMYTFGPDVEMLKQLWSVARNIAYDNFVMAVCVGLSIVFGVRFMAKRWPKLNENAHPAIERAARWTAPYVSRAIDVVGPPIGRFFRMIGRGIAAFFRAVWRAIASVGRALGRLIFGSGRPHRKKRTYRSEIEIEIQSTHDDEPEENDVYHYSVQRRSFWVLDFVRDNYMLVPIYVTMWLGANEYINSPQQALGIHVLKVVALVGILLLQGWTYRTVLGLFFLECFLWWVSSVEGANVGTVYMLMFFLMWLGWLAFKHYILDARQEQPRAQEG